MRDGLSEAQVDQLALLLEALAAEPDPPTTVSRPGDAARIHLADSLSALDLPAVAAATRIADIGAGAGFPGLALAVALPAAHVDLVESTRRKCEVIERLAAAAGVSNAGAVPERAEDWAAGEGAGAYEVVTARALAPLAVLAEYAAPLLAEGGVLVAWKGRRDGDEEAAGAIAGAQVGLAPEEVRHVVPYAGAREHHLHVLRKVEPDAIEVSAQARPGAQAAPGLSPANREGLDRSGANQGNGGEFPTAPVFSLRDRWAPSSRSPTRRAAWARPRPPSTSRPASPTPATRPCWSTSTRSATPP